MRTRKDLIKRSKYILLAIMLIVSTLFLDIWIEPLKFWSIFLLPLLLIALLCCNKNLKFPDKSFNDFNLLKVEKSKYLGTMVVLQLLFYIATFWMFSCYTYHASYNNYYVVNVNISDFINVLKHHGKIYLILPWLAYAGSGISILYLITQKNQAPFLTTCIYPKPKKGILIQYIVTSIEMFTKILILSIWSALLILTLSRTFNFTMFGIKQEYFLLSFSFMYAFLLISRKSLYEPIVFLSKKKCSLGFILFLYIILCVIILALIESFYLPFIISKTAHIYLPQVKFSLSFFKEGSNKFETLLLGWFFINMPIFGNIIGKLSYGYTARESIKLNILASFISGNILYFVVLENWNDFYYLLINNLGIMFYMSLAMLFLTWLYASNIKSTLSLWIGPMNIFPTVDIKNRNIFNLNKKFCIFLPLMFLFIKIGGFQMQIHFFNPLIMLLLPVYFFLVGKIIFCLHSTRTFSPRATAIKFTEDYL